jgi:hypothetical protein
MFAIDGSIITAALHIHTEYSPCGVTRIDQIEKYCLDKEIDVVAITDHDTIAGALALEKIVSKIRVIVGEEVTTREGEIVGLFLREPIKPRQSAKATCMQIKEQGGMVYVPHLFDPFKIHRLKTPSLLKVIDLVDIIEVFNAKTSLPMFNRMSVDFAKRHHKPGAAGSDAHYLESIDMCTMLMADFSTPQEFLANLADAELVAKRGGRARCWLGGVKNVLGQEGHKVRRRKIH